MSRLIYMFISFISKLHYKILSLNYSSGMALTDKQLHFLVIGALGFAMVFFIQPIFRWLAKHNFELFVTFIYVFTVIVVISFAIELGQAWSGTGDMDLYDIAAGMLGFLVFFCVYLILYIIYRGLTSKKA
ncbi:MAG: hypothetical protein IKX97_02405 [Erysipelotrichaceae bacterium]|nr:hypothetical protein [Erysipelotrichaceae bacterium]